MTFVYFLVSHQYSFLLAINATIPAICPQPMVEPLLESEKYSETHDEECDTATDSPEIAFGPGSISNTS